MALRKLKSAHPLYGREEMAAIEWEPPVRYDPAKAGIFMFQWLECSHVRASFADRIPTEGEHDVHGSS